MITAKMDRVWQCPRCGMQMITPLDVQGAFCRCPDSVYYGGITDMIEVEPRAGIRLEFFDEPLLS